MLPQQTVLESAQLDFPAVRAETKFLVRWLENSNRVIGMSTVLVYPTNLLAELNPLLAGQELGVLDPNDSVKPLLKQNGVKFTDLGESALEDFRGRLAILGPFSSKSQLPEAMLKRCKSWTAKAMIETARLDQTQFQNMSDEQKAEAVHKWWEEIGELQQWGE